VKCHDILNITTVHCFVCDICVDNWDHHCFWLNTCINDQNKKAFNFFYYTFILNVFINTALIVFSNYIYYLINFLKKKLNKLDFIISVFKIPAFDNYFESLFGNSKNPIDKEDIEKYRLIWKIIFTIFLFSIIYTILYIIM